MGVPPMQSGAVTGKMPMLLWRKPRTPEAFRPHGRESSNQTPQNATASRQPRSLIKRWPHRSRCSNELRRREREPCRWNVSRGGCHAAKQPTGAGRKLAGCTGAENFGSGRVFLYL